MVQESTIAHAYFILCMTIHYACNADQLLNHMSTVTVLVMNINSDMHAYMNSDVLCMMQ